MEGPRAKASGSWRWRRTRRVAGKNNGIGKVTSLTDIVIAPTAIEHAEGIIRLIDIVARERKYFDVFEAAPSSENRASI